MTNNEEIVQQEGAGRPTKYSTSFNKQAKKLCLLGATDAQLADFFEVAESTLNEWKIKYPRFKQAIRSGKTIADADIADSLFKRAKGYDVIEVTEERVEKITAVDDQGEITKDVKLVETKKVTKHIPGDVTAQKFVLINRQRQNWTDRSQVDSDVKVTREIFKIGDSEIEF